MCILLVSSYIRISRKCVSRNVVFLSTWRTLARSDAQRTSRDSGRTVVCASLLFMQRPWLTWRWQLYVYLGQCSISFASARRRMRQQTESRFVTVRFDSMSCKLAFRSSVVCRMCTSNVTIYGRLLQVPAGDRVYLRPPRPALLYET